VRAVSHGLSLGQRCKACAGTGPSEIRRAGASCSGVVATLIADTGRCRDDARPVLDIADTSELAADRVRGMRRLLIAVAACGGASDAPAIDATLVDGALDPDGSQLVPLDKTPTTYQGTCDGSGALALSFTHFLDLNDEDQVVRIYERAKPAGQVQSIDIGGALGLAADAEADLEDVTRIGDRVFVTTSHGRTAGGELDRARYKFAAFDVGGAIPDVTLASAGTSSLLLDQMLIAANWETPNTAVIAALTTSSKLGDNNDADLAPEIDGTNIEALANDGTGKLLVGFRNPRPGNKAIVVQLANPDAALAGTARFGGAAELDLGGLGIRAMAYSPVHQAVMIVAGSHAPGTVFKLYTWSGVLTAAPVFVTDIVAPPQTAPEAVVPYPNTKDVQIVFDGGDATIGNVECKDAPEGARVFLDAIVTVD
jgi:hypothetical protein